MDQIVGSRKGPSTSLRNERDKKRNVQAVKFARAQTINHYNPVASAVDLPPPVSTPPIGVGAVMSQRMTTNPAASNHTL
jgi:hypothetical protein